MKTVIIAHGEDIVVCSILDFKQAWSFVLSHVRIAALIRRGTHYA
jgi:hypothetical protein